MALDLSQIDVYEFLNDLGMNNIRDEGQEVKYSCFSDEHFRGDVNPSASMKKGSTIFYCFSCGMSGNAISFLSILENVSPIQSSIWIKERFGGSYSVPQGSVLDNVKGILKGKTEPKKNAPGSIIDENEADRRKVDWKSKEAYFEYTGEEEWETMQDAPFFYMLKRGFSVKTLTEWKIGWDKISERITIPIRNEGDELVGFKGRSYNKKPRYLVLGGNEYGFEPYETRKILFGLKKATESERYFLLHKELIICEGELNAIAMHQHGYGNTVGISGKILSDEQVSLVRKYSDSAILFFDEEDDAIRAAKKLDKSMSTSIIGQHEKDAADMTTREVSRLLTNRKSLLQC